MWTKSQNGNDIKPVDFFQDDSGIIVRRNFTFIEEINEEQPAHWEFEEWQMTPKQYAVWLVQQADIDFLNMENEYLEEESEQARADIDYLLMITEEV